MSHEYERLLRKVREQVSEHFAAIRVIREMIAEADANGHDIPRNEGIAASRILDEQVARGKQLMDECIAARKHLRAKIGGSD